MVIRPGADVSPLAVVDPTASVWDGAVVREASVVGAEAILGRGCYVGPGVVVGARAKVQNAALVYEPAVVGPGAFIGPAAVLTNDLHPRAVLPDGRQKQADDWAPVGVAVGEGASVGARAVCVAPVSIGRWSMVAAGAVVTRDVPDFALVAGVPARAIGWVGRAGHRLTSGPGGGWLCPVTGAAYIEVDGTLREAD